MKYSIITINYNNADGLRRTIESVVNQTYKDIEYIIIDGGSTDGSVDVIKEYGSQIDYWVSEPDKGIYNAMNKGILQAHGEYLNFMNSGDCFYDCHRLQKVTDLNSNSDIIVGKDLHICPQTKASFASLLPQRTGLFHFYLTTIPHQSSFIKKTLFQKFMYDESLKIVADWEFFMKSFVFEGCTVSMFQDIVALCEPRGVSIDRELAIEERRKVLKTFFPPGLREEYDLLSNMPETTFDNILFICGKPRLRRFFSRVLKVFMYIYKLINKK